MVNIFMCVYSASTQSISILIRYSTGATGYIGGDALYALHEKHPEYNYTALVRTEEKGKQVTEKYPDVRIVQGDNDSSDLLKKEAANADIVIRESDCLIPKLNWKSC